MFQIVKCFHADHGVTPETMAWAVEQIAPEGFFLRTLTLPPEHPDLENGLWGPASGDAPVHEGEVHYAARSPDRAPSRMVARAKRPTRLLTVIGTASPEGVMLFTAFGGPSAEKEPGDRSLVPGTPDHDRSVAFWAQHALASL